MHKYLLTAALALLHAHHALAFCGFYVAKADAKLFNKSSQVIIVRDGDHTVITMANDFQGDVKDFAIVIPVPVVLQESDIRVVQQYIFDKLDAYTAPRLVEYWDENPCPQPNYYNGKDAMKSSAAPQMMDRMESLSEAEDMGVQIEASYTIGEYDILVLSAKESDGLKTWLTQNGYKLPPNAEEALDPYIKDGTKFFVAKVNLDSHKASGFSNLRPLQLQFNSPKFMLPIRLGMANAESAQDLIVYAFTRKGRVEASNYRTTKLPTDREIPEFVQSQGIFGDFYKSVFDRSWRYEGRNSVILEYAWDISGQQSVKCDPCPTPLVTFAELREAGVWWINSDPWGAGYSGDLFVTRLHARYSRDKFPQDLQFVATPNHQNFQGRYVVRHPYQGNVDCAEGKRYKASLDQRRRKEVDELVALTGWAPEKYSWYYGGTSKSTGHVEPKPRPGIKDGNSETTVDGIGLVDASSSDTTTPPSEAEMLEGSENFIKRAQAAETVAPVSKRMVIFGVALALLAGGIGYRRWHGRQPKQDA